jgi:isoleucyl-tRNA synthetase
VKKYNEYKDFSFPAIEQDVLQFWEENQIFQKSIETREGKPSFTFYEGPPSANGMPGIHHVMARTIKDIFCRFKTLQGYQVKRKAGWDTHGLPVELQVEKELGITKDDIGKTITIEEYNAQCRKTVMRFTEKWEEVTRLMGYWVDMKDPYVTYHNEYIESVWWLLKQLHNQDLLYKGFTVQPYSPKAGTGLSSHELNLPGCYRDVTDTSITAQFKIISNSRWNKSTKQFEAFESPASIRNAQYPVYFLAWTTTPWTLPSNCALAVGEKITYVQVRTFNPYTYQPVELILAKDLFPKHFNDKAKDIALTDYKAGDKLIPYEIVAEYKGADLEGMRYEQLMPYITNDTLKNNAFRVLLGDFVTTEDGTGIVHTASVFGADDFRVCQANGVPSVMLKDEESKDTPLVNRQGQFTAEFKENIKADLHEIALKLGKPITEYELPKYMKSEYEEGELPAHYYASDVLISILLKEQNKAFKVEKYVHSYPHCWRTDKPILYYPLDSWFIRTTARKERLAELNRTINWKPESTGTGRFGNWLDNLVDWNLSRQRYWGIPLPVWRTEDGKEEKCVGSQEELKIEIEKANKAFGLSQATELKDLHRPYVDEIFLVSESGKKMFRETDLIDVWFDSGAMPYAQQHYPFRPLTPEGGTNSLSFGEGRGEAFPPVGAYPADFISEGIDQTRGWFFTLHAIAGMVFDSAAFKNVVSTGLVLDENGEKMSKSKGNVVEPFTANKFAKFIEKEGDKETAYEGEYEFEGALTKYGADATRWYMISNANPWDNLRFSWKATRDHEAKKVYGKSDGIEEVTRRFFGTLKNTYAFFALYTNLDNFRFEQAEIPLAERTESDRWIISKLNSLIEQVTAAYEDYEPTKAARLIQDFTNDDLSNWYVRLNRKRFWKSDYQTDKIAAYQTLYTCLETIAKLSSPIMPFYSERIFLDLNSVSGKDKSESVHLSDFPQVNPAAIDLDFEEKMSLAQTVSSLVHSIRKKANIRVRQPLSKILIPILDKHIQAQIQHVEDLILNEVNVKQIEYLADDHAIVVKSIKPNFKTLGAKYKQQMKEVQNLINAFTADDIALIEKEGKTLKGDFEIVLEDVLITSQDVEGLAVATENHLTVALDVEISPALRLEGLARDFVNRVQNYRKDINLDVQDKIAVIVQNGQAEMKQAITTFQAYICVEAQIITLDFADTVEGGQEFEIEEFRFDVKVELSK